MAKYLVETYYTCTFKVNHYLNDINETELKNLEKRDDGKFEVLDIKLDNRKTKNLDSKNNKKVAVLNGIITDSQDRCQNYFYYVRYFDVELINNKKLAIGSATDYSENYPDAPQYWLLNENKEIEKIGNTNIKKYSLNFELRK